MMVFLEETYDSISRFRVGSPTVIVLLSELSPSRQPYHGASDESGRNEVCFDLFGLADAFEALDLDGDTAVEGVV